MFYRLLGMVVWKFATAYVRQKYARKIRIAAIGGLTAVAIAGYLATRSGE